SAATSTSASGPADVNVTMGDMWIKTDRPSVKAGKVTFDVKNTGAMVHGMALSVVPVKLDGGSLDESALFGVGKDLEPGAGERLTARLEPGSYMLVCHVPGHYAAGQKLPFTVTN